MIQIEREDQHHEYYYGADEVAKMLALKDDKGKLIGRNKFIEVLRYNKIVVNNNQPSQFYLNMGFCILHKTTKSYITFPVIMFSAKGINYLSNGFKSGNYIIGFQKVNKNKIMITDIC
jgi:phage antirepressor YoqD-like protein